MPRVVFHIKRPSGQTWCGRPGVPPLCVHWGDSKMFDCLVGNPLLDALTEEDVCMVCAEAYYAKRAGMNVTRAGQLLRGRHGSNTKKA